MERYTVSMPLLPSALPPKGEARRYVANDFLNLIALPEGGSKALWRFALGSDVMQGKYFYWSYYKNLRYSLW